MKTIIRLIYRTLVVSLKSLIVLSVITGIAATYIVQTSGDNEFSYRKDNNLIVNDVTGLNPTAVGRIFKPEETSDIVQAISLSEGPISIGGGRYSMGGQIAFEDSLHIDMRNFNQVLGFDAQKKTITVQTGITWRDIQQYIDPHNLSIRIMQTYSNFTVGGSLSVNVHGRYIGEGPLIKSVLSIKLVLANGKQVIASRQQNSELFLSAIGGYGGIGVITEATLKLTDNVKIERKTSLMNVSAYKDHFFNNIRNNDDVVFHNGDLYPPDYTEVLDVSWYKTDKELTQTDKIIDRQANYFWGPKGAEFVADYDIGKSIRKNIIDPIYYSFDRVVWRNWEASYDVRELEPDNRKEKTYVLREYFIPVENFDAFVPVMKDIFNRNDANIINVSIRHAEAAPENYLSWANKEVFAFVVYYQQGTDQQSRKNVKKWSVEMIDAVIAVGGTYYLPYQIFATPEQFSAAYPRADEFFAVKRRVDPENRFRNELWKHYYPSSEQTLALKKASIQNYYRAEEQTFLTIPEWYLVFNPLEYADYLESGQSPDEFPFMQSIDEYWTLYDRVTAISEAYPTHNAEYMTMLKVIGVSTTIEYMYKSLYEYTIGRLTRKSAEGKDIAEDKIIAQAHRAYSDLVFDEAWYMFDFWSWVNKIWVETDLIGPQFVRGIERKLFFTLEFGFKTLYAKLIGYAAQTAYEPSEGLVYMTVTIPPGLKNRLPEQVKVVLEESGLSLISVPRWGLFSKILPQLLSEGVRFKDISGNNNIAVTVIMPAEDSGVYISAEELFTSSLVSDYSQQRKVLLTPVAQLDELMLEVASKNHRIEHIYDY